MEIKNTMPLVSVCIPMYNAERYIVETLTSLQRQTYPNIEIIIVDDHSTDNSYQLAEQFISDTLHLYRNPRKGGNAARNYAFEKSKGDYIKFFDADDFATDGLIEKQVQVLQRCGTDYSVAYSPFKHLYLDGSVIEKKRASHTDYSPAIELLIAMRIYDEYCVTNAYLITRKLAVAAGGWDENIWRLQDTEYFARILLRADKAWYVEGEYAIYRMGNGVHSHVTKKAVYSVSQVYLREAKIALAYRDSEELRRIYSIHLGNTVYSYYFELYSRLPEILQEMHASGLDLIFPSYFSFNLCKKLLGWKLALFVIRGKDRILNKYYEN